MSYCVHCGVELADYETKCPLCETPVIDPHRPEPSGEPMFVDRIEPEKKINKRFIVALLSIVLLIPFAVTTAIDITLSLGMTWSAYVLGAVALFWVWFILPFLCPGANPYLLCAADVVSTALYIYLVCCLENSYAWYVPFALPVTLISGVELLIMVHIHRSARIGKLTKAGLGIFALSFLPLAIDVLLAHYNKGTFMPQWSWYASVPLFVLGLTVTLLSLNRRFTSWLRKKLFV